MSKTYQQQKQHAPEDTSVKMPAAIRAAAIRANQMHDEAYVLEQPVAANEEVQQVPVQTEQVQEKPEGQAEPAPEPQQPENFERKYHSLKGRYDQQNQTIAGLNNRIADMERQLRQPVQQPTFPNPDLQFKAITAEDKDAYGEDFLDVAARAAQEKLSPEIAALKKQIAELNSRVGGVQQATEQNTQQQMWKYLDDNLKNWRELNRDPNFIAWVGLQDPYSGAIRQQMMRDAYEQGDGARVLRFFNGFLSDEAATGPASVPTQPTPNNGKVPLEQFAAPGRAKAAAASPAPAEKETISQAQIASFYMNVQKGKYRGNEQEQKRLEQMIFDAQMDGRITP